MQICVLRVLFFASFVQIFASIGAYGEMLLKDSAFKELALRGRDNRISEIFNEPEWFDSCVHEGEDTLPID